MSQNQQDKRTKSQILRLLDHAMQQEEKLAEKIQTLENQLTECRKRAEDPRYEITESAIPASKVSFRLDYYRTEKKGPVRGIIEHLSSRESKSFGSDDGFDTIQQFIGKYLPVKARHKEKPIAPPSPFLEKTPPETAPVQPEATAEVETQPIAQILEENESPAEVVPVAAAEMEVQPVAQVLENEPATEPVAPVVAPETLETNLRQPNQSALPTTLLDTSERLAARIRRSLSLPAESGDPERPALPTIVAPDHAPANVGSQPRRLQQPDSSAVSLVTNERLAARIRRSMSLPTASSEPEEMPEVAFQKPILAQAIAAKKLGREASIFSIVADDGDQHQATLQHDQHFQVEIPAAQLPDFQGKMCHARLIAENLETGEQVRAADACQPGPSALRFPKRSMQLPAGGYRLTAVLGLGADSQAVFYRESRLVVVKPHPWPLSGGEG